MARRAVSVSSAAVELAEELLGSLKGRTTLIVGAGKMAKICAKHLLSQDGGKVLMVNRSSERLVEFSKSKLPNQERLNVGLELSDRYSLSAAADVVIVSTTAHEYLLTADAFAAVPRDKPTCIIDISVPRNVDPAIGKLPNVRLFDSDDLSSIVNRNLAEREALVSEAEGIVFQALESFHSWQRSLIVAPTIVDLRNKIEQIRASQVAKNSGCPNQASAPKELDELSRAIINQILHQPTVQLKSTMDHKQLKQQADTLRALFNLDIFGTTGSDDEMVVSSGRETRGTNTCPNVVRQSSTERDLSGLWQE